MKAFASFALALSLVTLASPTSAQSISIGLIGAYGSFDHIAFDCETSACSSDGEYTLQGVTVGLKLFPPVVSRFRPFLKGGVTLNNLKGGYGGSSSNGLTTDRSP